MKKGNQGKFKAQTKTILNYEWKQAWNNIKLGIPIGLVIGAICVLIGFYIGKVCLNI